MRRSKGGRRRESRGGRAVRGKARRGGSKENETCVQPRSSRFLAAIVEGARGCERYLEDKDKNKTRHTSRLVAVKTT